MHVCSTKQIFSHVQVQAHNQLRTSAGRNVLWEGPKSFKVCSTVLNYVQHYFPGGGESPCDALSYGPDLQVSPYIVFSTRVFPNPKPVFLAIFYYPKLVFFKYHTRVFKKTGIAYCIQILVIRITLKLQIGACNGQISTFKL